VSRAVVGSVWAIALCVASIIAQAPRPRVLTPSHGRLFPPQDLGLLEAPDRDIWQRPDQVMDVLGVAEASIVGDVGAGAGWFTIRLARRVGPNGIVYAEEVQPGAVTAISRRVADEGMRNVRTVLGQVRDPRLPRATLHAVLMVDTYHETEIAEDRVALLRNVGRSLRPDGRLGVIDFTQQGGGPGPPIDDRVAPDVVIREAAEAGLALLSRERFLPFQYFLVFGLESGVPAATGPAPSRPRAGSRLPRTP
jgi:SAM-dependent methyltransferase